MLSPPLRTSLGRSSISRGLAADHDVHCCCEQCHPSFDGCLQLSVYIWWWRDDRRERTLWCLYWQLHPLTESQFRDVTSDVIILVVHVVVPRSIQLGISTTASLSASYSSTGQTGGTQYALWLWHTWCNVPRTEYDSYDVRRSLHGINR